VIQELNADLSETELAVGSDGRPQDGASALASFLLL